MLTAKEAARFASKHRKKGGCLIWQGPLDRDGYGTFYLRRMSRRAHRVAWFSVHGDIPEGMVVNHVCRNRACVNPQHLQAVSQTESALRDTTSLGYINSQKTMCPMGHPYDRKYGKQRYCSTCDAAKKKRLRERWASENTLNV
jgi:hypothetical protein